MTQHIPTSYPDPYHFHGTADWIIFETLWRLYERGDRAPGDGGVLPEQIAEEVGVTRSTVSSYLAEMNRQGATTRLDALDPKRFSHRVSWAPSALVETREPRIPRKVTR